MSRLDIAVYAIGVVCLGIIFALGIWAMLDAILPRRAQIIAALFPRRASVALPPATRSSRPVADEAGCRSTGETAQ